MTMQTSRACVVLSLTEPTPGDIRIVAEPEEITISHGESICWEARVENGDRVFIEFERAYCGDEPRKGPFVPTAERPDPGAFGRTGAGPLDSTPADCRGRWKYSVMWRRPGWKAHTVDPYIIVRG